MLSEQNLRCMLLDDSSDPIFSFDREGRYLYANQALADGIGRRLEEIIGKTIWEVFSNDQAAIRFNLIRWVFERRERGEHEIRISRPDGDRYFMTTLKPIFDAQGQVEAVLAHSKDITDRKLAEETLVENEAYTRAILDSVSDLIAVIDQRGVITAVNALWSKFALENSNHPGTPAEHTDVGTNYLDVCRAGAPSDADSGESAADGIQAVLDGRVSTFSLEFTCHSPEEMRWFRMRVTPLRVSKGGAVIAHTDITERKRVEEALHQMAYFDPLTQLPNRRMLNDRLCKAMLASKRSGCYGALMVLDLDNFKPLNDAHGHLAGDALLMEVASRLLKCVRETDTVARVGGDEFVVMLGTLNTSPSESAKQAGEVAEKIRINLAMPYRLHLDEGGPGGRTVEHRCSASMGVALFLNHECSQNDLLKRADSAMYSAKEAGRNTVKFHRLMQ
jgi:diguanylate cyclase (GGDEF)-like protein/PAS domain S-box-containing protein